MAVFLINHEHIACSDKRCSVTIGGDHFVFGPGWGAPLLIDAYVKPDNDSAMEKDLERYVAAKLNG